MASRLLQIVPCQTKASSRFYTNYNVDKSKFKNVLVTGGSRGIGYIISESLAKRGMNVAGNYTLINYNHHNNHII